MSHSEDVLLANLSDARQLEDLINEGLPPECIPTEDARKIVQWSIDQYFMSGQVIAPSKEAIEETWGETLARNHLTLGDEYETDTMHTAVAQLKSQWVHYEGQQFLKRMGFALAEADPVDRVSTLRQHAVELMRLADRMTPKYQQTEAQQAIPDRISAFEFRVENRPEPSGLMFGLDLVDNHTYGIQDGELAVVAGGPKSGKSWIAARTALNNWKRGHTVCLFTLENSQDMTWDRIICLAAGVPYRKFQRGICDEHTGCDCIASIVNRITMLRPWLENLKQSGSFHIVQPGPGERTPQAIVEKTFSLNADILVIDQLTFMDHPKPGSKARWEILRDLMHDLKTLISSGNRKIPCLLMHQISREGVKAAQKDGKLEMYHLAEGSEVERTVDWAFGLYQTDATRADQSAIFSTLAARREATLAWLLDWTPELGFIGVQCEYEEKKEEDEDGD